MCIVFPPMLPFAGDGHGTLEALDNLGKCGSDEIFDYLDL